MGYSSNILGILAGCLEKEECQRLSIAQLHHRVHSVEHRSTPASYGRPLSLNSSQISMNQQQAVGRTGLSQSFIQQPVQMICLTLTSRGLFWETENSIRTQASILARAS
jgi:hypothetical protein